MQRQVDISTQRNSEITRYHLESMGLLSRDKALIDEEDRLAKEKLGSWGWELWKEQSEESQYYHATSCDELHEDEPIVLVSRYSDQQSAPRRVTASGSKRCDCKFRVGFDLQCCHEIKASSGRFIPAMWASRWQQRPRLQVSHQTGAYCQIPAIPSTATLPARANDSYDCDDDNEDSGFTMACDDDSDNAVPADRCPLQARDPPLEPSLKPRAAAETPRKVGPPLRPPVSSVQGINKRDWYDVCTKLSNAGSGLPTGNQQLAFGLTVKLLEMVTSGVIDEGSAIDSFTVYTNQFGRGFADLYSQSELPPSLSQQGTKAGPPLVLHASSAGYNGDFLEVASSRHSQSGRPTSKRMRSSLENRSGENRANGCSFCRAISEHKRRDQCPKYLLYSSKYSLKENNSKKNINDLSYLANNLGNPTVFKTEVASPSLSSSALKTEELGCRTVPIGTQHVVVLRQFFSREYVTWINATRSTRYGSNTHPPVQETNSVVECLFLNSQADVIELDEKETFLLCSTVRNWITTKGSTSTRRVFSGLKSAAPGNIPNMYGAESFVSV